MEFAGHQFIHYLKIVSTPRKLERQERQAPGDAKHIHPRPRQHRLNWILMLEAEVPEQHLNLIALQSESLLLFAIVHSVVGAPPTMRASAQKLSKFCWTVSRIYGTWVCRRISTKLETFAVEEMQEIEKFPYLPHSMAPMAMPG